MKNYWFPFTIILLGATVVGGYNLNNYFNKSNLGKRTDSLSAEFIFKANKSEENKSCSEWKNGEISYKSEKECSDLIKEKWGNNLNLQPEMWISGDEESVNDILGSYFPETTKIGKIPLNHIWYEGPLACIKEIPSDKEKNEVHCYFISRNREILEKSKNITTNLVKN